MKFQLPTKGYITTFKVAGVPTFIHWSFPVGGLLIAAFLSDFSLPTATASVFAYTLLVLAHELGHAFFAKRAGMKVSALVVTAGGGACITEIPADRSDKLLLFGGGLLAQLVIFTATVAYLAMSDASLSPVASCFAFVFTFVNALMLIANVIPHPGNDGSMILMALKESGREA